MKILIIGSVASGKSTYSKKLSKELKIKVYEIDSIVHDDINCIKRTEEEQRMIIAKINAYESWIIEGTLRKHMHYLLDMADKIIFLDIPYNIRKRRIILRFIKQKLGIEKCNYKPTINMFIMMIKWNNIFEREKENFMNLIKQYNDKLIIKREV